jgi:hypothetical protein
MKKTKKRERRYDNDKRVYENIIKLQTDTMSTTITNFHHYYASIINILPSCNL